MLAETLKRAIHKSGETLYGLAKTTGVAQPVLYRFVHGQRDLTLRTADRLCAYFKLELRQRSR